MFLSNQFFNALFWSVITILFYEFGKALHRRRACWWASPLVIAPLLLILAAITLHVTYQEYIRGTHWLVDLLGPATVAFAIPIYEQRMLIRRHWTLLVIGAVAGSATAMFSSWELASLLGLDELLRLSLLPRSLSTPFAMTVSGEIGGVPGLTAVFVIITGLLGAAIGEGLLNFSPIRSTLAQGSLFGMGAHAVGTAKAHQIDSEVGAISGLVMVLAGLINVLAAPELAHFLR